MKFYVHCENPEFTIVTQWSQQNTGNLGTVLDLFMNNLTKEYPDFFPHQDTVPALYNSKGRVLELCEDVHKKVKHLDDLFVKFKVQNASESNVHVISASTAIENLNISSVDAKETCADTCDTFSAQAESSTKADEQVLCTSATLLIANQKYRKAIQLCANHLNRIKTSKVALRCLVTCYLKAGRPNVALTYSQKGLSMYSDDMEFLLMIGQCQVAIGDGDPAIETLLRYCKLARQSGGVSMDNKLDVQVLIARSYLLKGEKDTAINILQGVLRENKEHHEALVEYAALLFPIGATHAEEAMGIMLAALASHRMDKHVQEKFAELCSQPNGIAVLQHVAAKVLHDPIAVTFLATSLRDCGAIKEALKLFKIAHKCDPSDPQTLLTYIHTLELVERHPEAISLVKTFLHNIPSKSVGILSCLHMETFLNFVTDELAVDTNKDIPPVSMIEPITSEYSDNEHYLLAVYFTVVKILYMKGALQILPPILAQLAPCCQGRELHKTNIRNEAAYYRCIADIFRYWGGIPVVDISPRGDHLMKNMLYFLGDSHCIPPAWQTIQIKGEIRTIFPILSTGTKIWHLRPESKFYPKVNFYSAIRNIPDGATVITCLGEIDCREAFLVCWEKARYDTIEDAMETVIEIYLQTLKSIQQKHHWTIYIHPVPPVIDITRPIVMQFNRLLATKLLSESSIHYLNFVSNLLTPDGMYLKEEYQFDSTHLHPRYVSLLEGSLSEIEV